MEPAVIDSSESQIIPDKVEDIEDKYLSFPLADSRYGIDIQNVLEVVIFSKNMRITKVPNMSTFTKGIINLRGKVIPIIDLRLRFQLEETKYCDRTCFVVVNIHGVTTGLVVDTVSGVVTIPRSEIDPPPEMEESTQSKYIFGLGKTEHEVYILLDTEKLLYKKEIEELTKAD